MLNNYSIFSEQVILLFSNLPTIFSYWVAVLEEVFCITSFIWDTSLACFSFVCVNSLDTKLTAKECDNFHYSQNWKKETKCFSRKCSGYKHFHVFLEIFRNREGFRKPAQKIALAHFKKLNMKNMKIKMKKKFEKEK